MRSLFSVLLLAGCNGFSASIDVPDTDGGVTEDTELAHDTDPAPDSEVPDAENIDDDNDGFSENEGDCDDSNGSIHPNATDNCNGIDDNCNGDRDEDARMDDAYELNNGESYQLPSLAEAPDQSLSASLYNDNDEDSYDFYLDDPFYDAFTLYIDLGGIPNGAEYQLTLLAIEPEEGSPGVVDTLSGGGSLELEYDDSWDGTSQAGLYRVTVSSVDGADCGQPYTLSLEKTWL